MTQLDILSKNVMGAGARGVNVMGVGCVNPDEAKFKALYNEEVNFLANQGGGYRSNYRRQGGNKSWNRDEGWKNRDLEWRIEIPIGRMGIRIDMCLTTSVKSQRIQKVAGLRICFLASSTKLRVRQDFEINERRRVDP